MGSIKVKNFGPIKSGFTENDGFLDIRKITVFIGNQGTGKSSVANLQKSISIMSGLLLIGKQEKLLAVLSGIGVMNPQKNYGKVCHLNV